MKTNIILACSFFIAASCYAETNINTTATTSNTKTQTNINNSIQPIDNQLKPISCNLCATDQEKPWSLLFYRGTTAGQDFLGVITFHYSGIGETMYSAELAYMLSKNNPLVHWLYPYMRVQVAANIGQRFSDADSVPVTEGDAYLVVRWVKFPWEKYLLTSAAVGDGVSYVSHVPYGEAHDSELNPTDDLKKMLNYLMFEITVALPKYPDLQLVARLHHRCTAYGMYGSTRQGSTNVGFGIRYYF